MPPMHFEDLDPAVQDFLANLDAEKLGEVREALQFWRATRTVSKFLRWCLITFVAVFLTMAALGEAFGKIWGWLISLGGPK